MAASSRPWHANDSTWGSDCFGLLLVVRFKQLRFQPGVLMQNLHKATAMMLMQIPTRLGGVRREEFVNETKHLCPPPSKFDTDRSMMVIMVEGQVTAGQVTVSQVTKGR